MIKTLTLIVLGIFMIYRISALSAHPTTLPRPPIEGSWQVISIDQRAVPGGVHNFSKRYFTYGGSYLPIGTKFTIKFTGAWGYMEPTWMELRMTFHPPFPTLACADLQDKEPRRLMCNSVERDGKRTGPDKEETFLGHMWLHFLNRKDGGYLSAYEDEADLQHFMEDLGYHLGDPVFRFYADYWKDIGFDFVMTKDPNQMLIVGLHYDASGHEGLPISPLSGPVALLLDRVR